MGCILYALQIVRKGNLRKRGLVGNFRKDSILADNNTSAIGHRQREICSDPLLSRPDRHKMNPPLGLISPDLKLDIDPSLQMRDCPRDPRPAWVNEIDIVTQEFLGLSIEFDIEQCSADDGCSLTLMVGGDGDRSGPEDDSKDSGEDVDGGTGGDVGELGGLGLELGAVLGLVQGGCALESWVLNKL